MSYINPTDGQSSKVSITQLMRMKAAGEKITSLTAYDASFAALFDNCGIEVILIGDSLGNVIQGHSTTIPVTVENMAYHTTCVANGSKNALIIADMPFASYGDIHQALITARTLMQAGAHMVKLEGGHWVCEIIEHLVKQGIPVCAHLGLTPQSVNTMGGFKVQGKSKEAADQLILDAKKLEQAGAQLLVLEAIPASLGKEVTEKISIPTIGIGAGPDCSGQVLVMHDILGAFQGRQPKFVKNFLVGAQSIEEAIKAYRSEVKSGAFPAPEHCFQSN
jgi:3-methyl-2-oxobutanoate hydroxymethyltransferase